MKLPSQVCAGVASFIFAFSAWGAPASTENTDGGNSYIGGGDIIVSEPVKADLFAAGGHVNVEQSVGADGAVAGGSVRIGAPIAQDLRVAGGTVDIDANVGGELAAAGGTVTLAGTSTVAGSAMLSGGEVILAGKIGKSAKIYANKITISGEINGDARLYGREIILKPGARINGNLSYSSPNPLSQDASAQVSGTITREAAPQSWNRNSAGGSWFRVAFVLGMLAIGVLLFLLFPKTANGTQQAIRQYPVRTLLTGLVLLCAIPPAAIIFMVTVIGIPIGLVLVALYPVMLLLGYLGAALFIGRQAANAMKQPQQLGKGRQVLFLALALVALSLVGKIPFLGGLIVTVAVIAGCGGLAVWAYTRYSANHAPVPAS